MLRIESGIRPLGPPDLPALSELVARDPVQNVFIHVPTEDDEGGIAERRIRSVGGARNNI